MLLSSWIVFVITTTLLYMNSGDLLSASLVALFLFIFLLWPVAFVLAIIIEFFKSLAGK